MGKALEHKYKNITIKIKIKIMKTPFRWVYALSCAPLFYWRKEDNFTVLYSREITLLFCILEFDNNR